MGGKQGSPSVLLLKGVKEATKITPQLHVSVFGDRARAEEAKGYT